MFTNGYSLDHKMARKRDWIVLYFGIFWAHKIATITMHYINILFFESSLPMPYLRWSFSNPCSSAAFRVFHSIERKSFCCCTEHSTLVYRTVSISDISLPWLKMENEKWFQCLRGLFVVWYLIQTLNFEA